AAVRQTCSTPRSSDSGGVVGDRRRTFGASATHLRRCGLRSSLTHARRARCGARPRLGSGSPLTPNLPPTPPTTPPLALRYRLLALDLDGTILDMQLQLDPRDVAALDRIRSAGVTVVACTGRPFPGAVPWVNRLGLEGPIVCYQGAEVRT